MYVWVDALTNYITGIGYPDTESASYRTYWPAAAHVIGKDIVRFHAVYWPAFLMSAGLDLPKQIVAHGFLFNRGEKMSKSVGNVVDPFALPMRSVSTRCATISCARCPSGRTAATAMRRSSTASMPTSPMISAIWRSVRCRWWQALRGRRCRDPAASRIADKALLDKADTLVDRARRAMATHQLHTLLAEIWQVVGDANRYFASQEPWALRKTDPARMATVLYVTAETLRQTAILCQPVLPTAAGRLLDLLGVTGDARRFDRLGPDHRLVPGTTLPAPEPVLPRYVEPDPAGDGKERGMIVDSHCHLDFPDFADELDQVIARAHAADVRKMVTISTRVRRFDQVLAIAEAHDSVYCSVGTHPHNAVEETDITVADLVTRAAHPKVVAIGEAGLDYYYDKSPRDVQADGFRRHIAAARKTGLPLVIHSRDAETDTASILRAEMEQGAFTAVLHCFSSTPDLAWGGH